MDGSLAQALFMWPYGLDTDDHDSLYIIDGQNSNTIRAIYATDDEDRDEDREHGHGNGHQSAVVTIAGHPEVAGYHDGSGCNALFNYPRSIAVTGDGSVAYVTDTDNDVIRKIAIHRKD